MANILKEFSEEIHTPTIPDNENIVEVSNPNAGLGLNCKNRFLKAHNF